MYLVQVLFQHCILEMKEELVVYPVLGSSVGKSHE